MRYQCRYYCAIGGRGDHDAAKEWVRAHNASLAETVEALRSVTRAHDVKFDTSEIV